MSKFTPGPWRVVCKERLVEIQSPETSPMGTFPVYILEAPHYVGCVAEDARLISAAPEMYEALQLCVNAFGGYEEEKKAYEAGMAALAKAEGK